MSLVSLEVGKRLVRFPTPVPRLFLLLSSHAVSLSPAGISSLVSFPFALLLLPSLLALGFSILGDRREENRVKERVRAEALHRKRASDYEARRQQRRQVFSHMLS